jgi:hypothetical protein
MPTLPICSFIFIVKTCRLETVEIPDCNQRVVVTDLVYVKALGQMKTPQSVVLDLVT